MQKEIDLQLEKDLKKSNTKLNKYKKVSSIEGDGFEDIEAADFISESNLEILKEYLADDPDVINNKTIIKGLKPDIESMCRPSLGELRDLKKSCAKDEPCIEDLDLEGLDDEEINNYILTQEEAENKNSMWIKLNAEYLEDMKAKEARLAKEKEEGKPEKKKRRPKKKIIGPSSTPGEAIEKMLQEKKISTKINYDILRTLTEVKSSGISDSVPETVSDVSIKQQVDIKDVPIVDNSPIVYKNR